MAGEYQNLGVALKVVYPNKALEPMINEEAPFRAKLDSQVPAGSRITEGDLKFNGILALPQNVGQIIDGDDLQDAGERSEVQFQLKPTIFQSTMNIGWLTRRVANSSKSGFNNGENRRRTEEVIGNTGKFIESTYVGTAGTGIRGYVESSSGSGIVVLAPERVRLLRQGMKISVRTGTGGAPRATLDAIRIASVNPQTNRITLAGPPTYTNAVANDTIYVVTKAAQTLTNLFANGLRGLVDDGTNSQFIHGQDRTAVGNEKLKSVVKSNGGVLRNLTEQLLIRTCHEVRDGVGKRVTDCWTSPGQVEKYIEFVAPDRRRAVDGGNYDKHTGYKSTDDLVHYFPGGKFTLNTSFDLIPRELYLVSWDTWFRYAAQDMQWVDEGSLLHLAIGSAGYKARWDAFMASMENIGCDMPSANAVIRDLKAPELGD